MSKKPVIGVLGSGSWATALVKMLCENVEELNWWVRSQDTIDHIMLHGNNPKYIIVNKEVLLNDEGCIDSA